MVEQGRINVGGEHVGGVAGAVIGAQMDKQRDELAEDHEGAEVERDGEGVRVTFDGGLLCLSPLVAVAALVLFVLPFPIYFFCLRIEEF